MFNATKVVGIKAIEARILIGGSPRNYTKSEGVHLVVNQMTFFDDDCTLLLIVTESFYEAASKHGVSTKDDREFGGDDMYLMQEYMDAGNDL